MSSGCGAMPTTSLPLAVLLSFSMLGKVLSLILKHSSTAMPYSLYLQVNEWAAEAKMKSGQGQN